MSLSFDFMISIFLIFVLIGALYSLLSDFNSNVSLPFLNKEILIHNANYNSLFVVLNSYSIKHGSYDVYEVDCIVSNKIYCKNDELNLTGEAPVYLRRGGGN